MGWFWGILLFVLGSIAIGALFANVGVGIGIIILILLAIALGQK